MTYRKGMICPTCRVGCFIPSLRSGNHHKWKYELQTSGYSNLFLFGKATVWLLYLASWIPMKCTFCLVVHFMIVNFKHHRNDSPSCMVVWVAPISRWHTWLGVSTDVGELCTHKSQFLNNFQREYVLSIIISKAFCLTMFWGMQQWDYEL